MKQEEMGRGSAIFTGIMVAVFVTFLFTRIPGEDSEARQYKPEQTAAIETATLTAPEPHIRKESPTAEKLSYTVSEAHTEAHTEPQTVIHFTDDTRAIIKSVLMAECESEDTQGKALVVLIILNRLRSDAFPGTTIEEIVFAPNQFCISNKTPNEDCEEAIRLVESGWDGSHGALFFEHGGNNWVSQSRQYAFTHGGHNFYW